jgi:hypothetical protein
VRASVGYGRLFPDLEPLQSDERLLHGLGSQGGACDGAACAVPLTEAATAAGWPFFGQFVAHDITADRSGLRHHVDSPELRNYRSPQLNLECLYGDGPTGAPYLYDRRETGKLLLGMDDVIRNDQGTAIIGDPRNDSHLIVSQLHVAMLRFHNRIMDEVHNFGEARRLTCWHYQWIVLHEFLPELVGQPLVDDILTQGRRYYRPTNGAFIPLEFADAAYRYGHSQIRDAYRVNERAAPAPLFPDLIGFRAVPSSRVIDWRFFFDRPTERARQRAKSIDERLPPSLIGLPVAITGDVEIEAYHSLAVRDLQRGQAVGLPSGETIARYMGVPPLTRDEVGLESHGWSGETPLWYYILREAAVRADGERLGPVGGRIVAEVLVGLMDLDPGSFRSVDPSWRPTLPSATPTGFAIGDVLLT